MAIVNGFNGFVILVCLLCSQSCDELAGDNHPK